jgi:hypothetical protein
VPARDPALLEARKGRGARARRRVVAGAAVVLLLLGLGALMFLSARSGPPPARPGAALERR